MISSRTYKDLYRQVVSVRSGRYISSVKTMKVLTSLLLHFNSIGFNEHDFDVATSFSGTRCGSYGHCTDTHWLSLPIRGISTQVQILVSDLVLFKNALTLNTAVQVP